VVPDAWAKEKRATDIVVACIALVLTAPLLLLAIVAIVISSKGSPFFTQERVGLHGRRFKLYKLRTMRPGAHLEVEALRRHNEVSGPVFKMKNDPRVFPAGRLLRRFSIDELPNLFNVLAGQMSIVGPRPPLPSEIEHYDALAFHRLRVKPGITCLWQISGRSNMDFERWMKLDKQYVDSWTPLGDLKVIAATVPAVVFGIGAY
jgi:lipopolysaccharide/colanic/teichoic acid biosynthesis glycosyltransferase